MNNLSRFRKRVPLRIVLVYDHLAPDPNVLVFFLRYCPMLISPVRLIVCRKVISLFKESMTRELTNFIRSQAGALSLADLDRLIINLPALRKRLALDGPGQSPGVPNRLPDRIFSERSASAEPAVEPDHHPPPVSNMR